VFFFDLVAKIALMKGAKVMSAFFRSVKAALFRSNSLKVFAFAFGLRVLQRLTSSVAEDFFARCSIVHDGKLTEL